MACLIKGKAGKEREFRIVRLAGNFVFTPLMNTIRADDKSALPAVIELHQQLFGQETLSSLTADKGYYSKGYQEAINAVTGDFHLGYPYADQGEEDYHRLYNRRAEIEPIIEHIKRRGQLSKHRIYR